MSISHSVLEQHFFFILFWLAADNFIYLKVTVRAEYVIGFIIVYHCTGTTLLFISSLLLICAAQFCEGVGGSSSQYLHVL